MRLFGQSPKNLNKTRGVTKLTTKKLIISWLLLFVMFWLAGCAKTQQFFPVAIDEKPPHGKALIIVEREDNGYGGAVRWDVYDNSVPVGLVSAGGRLAWLRDPGPMDITFKNIFGKNPGRRLIVNAGEIYHYKVGTSFSDLDAFLCDGPGESLEELYWDQLDADWKLLRTGMSVMEVQWTLSRSEKLAGILGHNMIWPAELSGEHVNSLKNGSYFYSIKFEFGKLVSMERYPQSIGYAFKMKPRRVKKQQEN